MYIENSMIFVIFTSFVNATATTSMPYNTFVSLFDLGSVIVGALIGSIASFFFTWYWAKTERWNEIKKIRFLLQDDFRRICGLAMEGIVTVKMNSETLLDNKTVESLISEKIDLADTMLPFSLHFKLDYWDAIVNSASLIKLQPNEIRLIQTKVNLVHELTDLYHKQHREFFISINNAIHSKHPIEQKKILVKAALAMLLDLSNNTSNRVYVRLQELEEIPWIKLPKIVHAQIPTMSQNKGDKGTESQENANKNTK